MNDLDQRLHDLAGATPIAEEATVQAARGRVQQAVAMRVNPVRSWKVKAVSASIGVAAVALSAVLAVSVIDTSSQPTTHQYAATSELGTVFMEAASAVRAEPKVTDVWYVKRRDESYFVDDGTKYGRQVTNPTVSTTERWDTSNGLGATRGVGGPWRSEIQGTLQPDTEVNPDALVRWKQTMALPEDVKALRNRLREDARSKIAGLLGDKSTLPGNYEAQVMARDAIDLLGDPLRYETRSSLYVVLAEFADAGLLGDDGEQTDALGRKGIAFRVQWTEPGINAYDVILVAPKTGRYLEEITYRNGAIDSRSTFGAMGFVDEIGAVAANS